MKLLRNLLTIIIVLAMIGVGVLFALQNDVAVPLDLLFYQFEPRSLALWLLSSLAVGGVLGLLISSFIMVRQRASLGASRRQLVKARAEVDKLRTAGLTEGE
jgi:putative membrane protein